LLAPVRTRQLKTPFSQASIVHYPKCPLEKNAANIYNCDATSLSFYQSAKVNALQASLETETATLASLSASFALRNSLLEVNACEADKRQHALDAEQLRLDERELELDVEVRAAEKDRREMAKACAVPFAELCSISETKVALEHLSVRA
jgi:hypothetical protein